MKVNVFFKQFSPHHYRSEAKLSVDHQCVCFRDRQIQLQTCSDLRSPTPRTKKLQEEYDAITKADLVCGNASEEPKVGHINQTAEMGGADWEE